MKKTDKFADFNKIEEIVQSFEGKDLFIQALEFRKNYNFIEEDGFTKLCDILKKILRSLADDESSQMHFCKIIAISHVFYTETNGSKRYLSDSLRFEHI